MSESDYFFPLLIYDAECTMCVRFKEALKRLPQSDKICMVSLFDEKIYQLVPQLDQKECFESIHLVTENKEILKGPQVIEYLVKFYPGINKFAWLIETGVGKKAVEIFYDSVKKYRQSIYNKCASCKRPGNANRNT